MSRWSQFSNDWGIGTKRLWHHSSLNIIRLYASRIVCYYYSLHACLQTYPQYTLSLNLFWSRLFVPPVWIGGHWCFSTLLQAVITGGMGQRCTQKDEVIVWHHADHLTTALATSATGRSCGLHRSKAKLLAQLTSCLTCMSLLGSGFTFNNLDRGRTSPVLLGRALLCSPHPL